MAVDVTTDGQAFRPGSPRALFKTASMFEDHGGIFDYPYDVAADGRFIVNERATPVNQSSPLTVVLNWRAALKK